MILAAISEIIFKIMFLCEHGLRVCSNIGHYQHTSQYTISYDSMQKLCSDHDVYEHIMIHPYPQQLGGACRVESEATRSLQHNKFQL